MHVVNSKIRKTAVVVLPVIGAVSIMFVFTGMVAWSTAKLLVLMSVELPEDNGTFTHALLVWEYELLQASLSVFSFGWVLLAGVIAILSFEFGMTVTRDYTRRKEIFQTLKEGIKNLPELAPKGGTVLYPLQVTDGVVTASKRIEHIDGGDYAIMTSFVQKNSTVTFSEVTFSVSENSFASSNGASTDTIEVIAAILMVAKLQARQHS